VQPAESTFAGLQRHLRHDVGLQRDHVRPHLDLTMIGHDHHGGAGGHDPQHVGHEPIGGRELGVVVLAEPVLVTDLVDTFVVAVHERLGVASESRDVGHERRRHSIAVEAHTVEMRRREAGARELSARDDRRTLAEERQLCLHLLRWDRLTSITRRRRPPQDVEHLAVHVHPIADDPVLTRRQPGRHRRERRGRRGRQDRGDRATLHRRERRREMAAGL